MRFDHGWNQPHYKRQSVMKHWDREGQKEVQKGCGSGLPALNDEQIICTPGLGRSVNLLGRGLHGRVNTHCYMMTLRENENEN